MLFAAIEVRIVSHINGHLHLHFRHGYKDYFTYCPIVLQLIVILAQQLCNTLTYLAAPFPSQCNKTIEKWLIEYSGRQSKAIKKAMFMEINQVEDMIADRDACDGRQILRPENSEW